MKRARLAVLLPCLLAAAGAAHALTTCTVTAVGPVFGIYDPLQASPTNANGSVTVTCTIVGVPSATVTAIVSLSAGSAGSYASRAMFSGASSLNYNLYTNSAYTQVWGDGTGGTSTVTDTFNLSIPLSPSGIVLSSIFGQIPANQSNVAAGIYLDTVTVTVSY